jgi:uncharacterized membrane protein
MMQKSKAREESAMKKIIILVIAAELIAVSGPISAAEHKTDTNEKELCVLYAKDCANKVYGMQKKIRKIQNELAKGSTVYNAEEIKKLKDKLKEAEDMLYKLTPSQLPQK